MTLRRMLRPALVCFTVMLGAGALASCSAAEGETSRFESLAQHVADIRLDGSPGPASLAAEPAHMRPAMAARRSPLKVELMDVHDLWDARDGGLRGAVGDIGDRAAQVAAPVVAQAVLQRASLSTATMRPAIAAEPAEPVTREASDTRTLIQIGAYSSPEAARVAWANVSKGSARGALSGLSPVYEAVEVKGRQFTRLKIAAPAASGAAICQAVAVSDPWCARHVSAS